MNFEDKVHNIQDILNKLLAKQETNTYGGQKMFDVMAFTKSLKIAQIVEYISNGSKSKWKDFWDFCLKNGEEIQFFVETWTLPITN